MANSGKRQVASGSLEEASILNVNLTLFNTLSASHSTHAGKQNMSASWYATSW
jgi:hypothetical protein